MTRPNNNFKVKLNRPHRAIWAIAIVGALLIPASALASSYTGTLSFKVSQEGAFRSYNGSNITISMTAKYSSYHRLNKYFQVSLQRKTWYGHTTIGTYNFLREGSGMATWTNVGPGTYRFYFSKANDGVTITSNNVKMYN